MSDPAANLDLSVLPPAYRAAFEELRTLVARQEALIHELNHALYGKKSEKLTEDERQLAFEEGGLVRHWFKNNGRVRSPSRRWRRRGRP